MRKKAGFTHNMSNFGHDVREKRFNTHGELHCKEMTISKDHVAEKPRRGWDLWRHGRPWPCEWVAGDINITMITSGASCRDAATLVFWRH